MTNINPITGIIKVGDAAAKGLKGKAALEARGNATNEMNDQIINDIIFRSAKKSDLMQTNTLWHDNKDHSLGQYTEKIFKIDIDGDSITDAYAKAFFDEKGHLYAVQAAKGNEPSKFTTVNNDTDLELIDSRFRTSADNTPEAPKPPKEPEKDPFTHPQSINDIDKFDFSYYKMEWEISDAEAALDFDGSKAWKSIPKDKKKNIDTAGDLIDARFRGVAGNGYNRGKEKIQAGEASAKPYRERYNQLVREEIKSLYKQGKIKLSDINIGFSEAN